MQKSDETSMSKSSHRKMQASTTLSRKYTKRPTMSSEIKIPKSLKISRFNESEMSSQSSGMMGEMSMSMEMQPEASMSMKEMMRDEASMSRGAAYAPETMPVYPDYPDYPDYPEDPISMYSMEKSSSMGIQERTRMRQQSARSMQSTPATRSMKSMRSMQPMQSAQSAKSMRRSSSATTLSGVTAKEMKEQAIKKAMSSASKVEKTESKKTKKSKKTVGMRFGFGRVVLALTCASVAVMAIVYFVNLNMPDISLSVAAMQNGMNVVYPSYVPRDYSVSSVTSEEGKVTITFDNSAENRTFSLTEESSSWDTNALLTNYVKKEYGENYTVVKEQGLTLYISGSNAAWVNGGNVYKITAGNGTLTNKQIKSIAVSL